MVCCDFSFELFCAYCGGNDLDEVKTDSSDDLIKFFRCNICDKITTVNLSVYLDYHTQKIE